MGKFSRLQVLCNFRLWRGGRPEGGGGKKKKGHCRHCRPSPLTDKHAVLFSHSSLLFDAILICSSIGQLVFFFSSTFQIIAITHPTSNNANRSAVLIPPPAPHPQPCRALVSAALAPGQHALVSLCDYDSSLSSAAALQQREAAAHT